MQRAPNLWLHPLHLAANRPTQRQLGRWIHGSSDALWLVLVQLLDGFAGQVLIPWPRRLASLLWSLLCAVLFYRGPRECLGDCLLQAPTRSSQAASVPCEAAASALLDGCPAAGQRWLCCQLLLQNRCSAGQHARFHEWEHSLPSLCGARYPAGWSHAEMRWKGRCLQSQLVADGDHSEEIVAALHPDSCCMPRSALIQARHPGAERHCVFLQDSPAVGAVKVVRDRCCHFLQFLEPVLDRIVLSIWAACFLAVSEVLLHLLLPPGAGPPKPQGLRSPTGAQHSCCEDDTASRTFAFAIQNLNNKYIIYSIRNKSAKQASSCSVAYQVIKVIFENIAESHQCFRFMFCLENYETVILCHDENPHATLHVVSYGQFYCSRTGLNYPTTLQSPPILAFHFVTEFPARSAMKI